MKVTTVSEKIKRNILNAESLKNLRKFAKKEGMMIKSIPLRDGTAAKLLANQNEFDCLIMQNGKVVASRGISGNFDDIGISIERFYDHLQKRDRAVSGFDYEYESLDAVDKYICSFCANV